MRGSEKENWRREREKLLFLSVNQENSRWKRRRKNRNVSYLAFWNIFWKIVSGKRWPRKWPHFFALCKAGPFPIISEKILLLPSAQPNPNPPKKEKTLPNSPFAGGGERILLLFFWWQLQQLEKGRKRQKWFNSASLFSPLFLYGKCVGGCVFLSRSFGVFCSYRGWDGGSGGEIWKWKERKGSPNICLVRMDENRKGGAKAKEVIDDWNRGGRRKPRWWKMKIKRFPSKTNNRNLLQALPRSVFPSHFL